jgi:hypothetical protein
MEKHVITPAALRPINPIIHTIEKDHKSFFNKIIKIITNPLPLSSSIILLENMATKSTNISLTKK